MKKPKLSPAQVKVLRALDNGALANFIPGLDVTWYLSSDLSTIRITTIDKLKSLGFISISKDSLGYPARATITPSGLAYLAELEGKEDA